MQYRPEIDGLRAIAVCAVILYHAQITILGYQPFKGGFIGVDIFFVISGYLITSIILKELVTTGSFSFKHFYERRVRRILPALLFVIFICLLFGVIILMPLDFMNLIKSGISALLFLSNYYFMDVGLNYGHPATDFLPLLHTWSLSIEEQFYLIFPPFLFFLFKFFRKKIYFFLIILFLLSLITSSIWTLVNNDILRSYYSIQTRFWEILAGSIVALYEVNRKKQYYFNHQSITILLSFVVIILVIFLFDQNIHPSIYTLPAIFATSSIILFGGQGDIISRFLSNTFIVKIGKISYSLYLWHFPIFAFDRILGRSVQSDFFILIIITFTMSTISYHLVETRARSTKFKIKYILLSYLIILTISYLLILQKNEIHKYFYPKEILDFNELELRRADWERCKVNLIVNENFCEFGNFNKKVYLIGDSHIIPLERDLALKLNKIEYSLVSLYQPGNLYKRKKNADIRYEYLSKVKNSILVFGGFYQRDNDEKRLFKEYSKDFTKFKENGNKIFFILPIPEQNFNLNLYRYKFDNDYSISVPKSKVDKRNSKVYNLIAKLDNLIDYQIEPRDLFCDSELCYALYDKEIYKSDFDHPSLRGAEMINDLILKEIENIELSNN